MKEFRTQLFLEQDLYSYLNKIFPTNKEFDKFLLELYKVVRNKICKSDLTTRSLSVLQKYYPKLTSEDLKKFSYNKEMVLGLIASEEIKTINVKIKNTIKDLQHEIFNCIESINIGF